MIKGIPQIKLLSGLSKPVFRRILFWPGTAVEIVCYWPIGFSKVVHCGLILFKLLVLRHGSSSILPFPFYLFVVLRLASGTSGITLVFYIRSFGSGALPVSIFTVGERTSGSKWRVFFSICATANTFWLVMFPIWWSFGGMFLDLRPLARAPTSDCYPRIIDH